MPAYQFKPISDLPRKVCERIFERIEIRGPDDCWLWQGAKRNGYGLLQLRTANRAIRSKWLTHRIAYFLYTGVDPADKAVCHTCDTPLCHNPKHLFLGTIIDNRMDCVSKGRHNIGSNHGRARLTEIDVLIIWTQHKLGVSSIAIGKQFNVAHSTIREIIRGATWKHIKNHGTEGI